MSDFRRLEDGIFASPQIDTPDVATAHELGISLIINNRPEGESGDQTPGAEIESAARAAGMEYCAIPITHAGFSEPQVDAMVAALKAAQGPVLAYCRSGTRSTLLWALAQAKSGRAPDELAQLAANAGYNLGPIRPMLDMLASRG
ncbi:TIGR01244 family sulfur transferase [Tsuneonella sp. CC-YZS046]|uniref:TIGR01244 family sulfur transferase n=1 Tax=Tsuneonella sp. CC-YZS046 TaxID=3042152 RepID=UPI002D79D136|nr:TIGR01244 family sulfur transferase [Tsuneonella sp. CC-YZS046]WRO65826.1 TIGR01244 family sulfur transferase [Tsuneonella sp. CC-YZS046]